MITELTEEMKAQIPVYIEKQVAISMDTREADWVEGERIVRRLLEVAKVQLDPKFKVIKCRNPILAAQAGNILKKRYDGSDDNKNFLFQAATYGGLSARNNFFVEVVGVKLPPDLEENRCLIRDFVATLGGVYFHSAFSIMYDRPAVLKIRQENGTGILHCEDGPAIAWGRDEKGNYDPNDKYGYKMYFWQGTRVPEKWIENKPNPDDAAAMRERAIEVLKTENQEQLRAGCEILGWVPVLESLGMKVLDEDPNPAFGKLVSVNLPGAEDSRFIVAQCGTGRLVAVPASSEAKTAVEAGAMSYGVPVAIYQKMKVRT